MSGRCVEGQEARERDYVSRGCRSQHTFQRHRRVAKKVVKSLSACAIAQAPKPAMKTELDCSCVSAPDATASGVVDVSGAWLITQALSQSASARGLRRAQNAHASDAMNLSVRRRRMHDL
jgi:hypothetical protein